MNFGDISQLLHRAEAASAGDPSARRLVEVATAVESVVCEVPNAGDDANRQLHKLAWIICQRCGGRLCDDHETLRADCARSNSCMLDRP